MFEGVTLHQLQCFEAIVSEGSFQAAAEKLSRAQPSVSSSVKNLENQLQLTLLDRSGYRVTLTEAGRSFYQRTRLFLQEAKRLGQVAHETSPQAERGTLIHAYLAGEPDEDRKEIVLTDSEQATAEFLQQRAQEQALRIFGDEPTQQLNEKRLWLEL